MAFGDAPAVGAAPDIVGGMIESPAPYSAAATPPTPAIAGVGNLRAVSYILLRAHENVLDLVCRLLLEKKKKFNLI